MKKTYKNPSLRIIDEVVDTPLLGASNILVGKGATQNTQGSAGNGGDGLVKAEGSFDW